MRDMTLDLWSGGIFLGSVVIAEEPVASGWLRPTRAYAPTIAPILLRASARIASDGLCVAPDIDAAIWESLRQAYSTLRLTDARGGRVPTRRIELWDTHTLEEPPFVLVEFGEDDNALAERRATPSPYLGASEPWE